MEFKGVCYVVLMIMVILFTGIGNAAVDPECVDRCQHLCGGNQVCLYRCVMSCPGVAQLYAEGHHHDDQYYCKLGCSTIQCLRYRNDHLRMGRCVDHYCAYKICHIKPGAPAPSPLV